MSNQKTYTGKELLNILKKIGFQDIRVKGSHHFIKHDDGRTTLVPVHSNEDLGVGLLKKILKDIELSSEDLENI